MKNNLWLLAIFIVLLSLTWFMVERPRMDFDHPLDEKLQTELTRLREITLPEATLMQVEQEWQVNGEPAQAEALAELHSVLEQLKVKTVLVASEIKDFRRADYFTKGLWFALNGERFQLGDLSQVGDSFYMGLADDPNVYVISLTDMSSQAVGETERLLQLEKYQRLRDLFSLKEVSWRDHRLFFLSKIGPFDRIKGSEYEANILQWRQSPFLDVLGKALQDKLANILIDKRLTKNEVPTSPAETVWEFFQQDKTVGKWQVWSSGIVRTGDNVFHLPPASMALANGLLSQLIQEQHVATLLNEEVQTNYSTEFLWHDYVQKLSFDQTNKRWGPSTTPQDLLLLFESLSQELVFEHIRPVSRADCQKLSSKVAQIRLQSAQNQWSWLLIPHEGGFRMLACDWGMQWEWKTALSSELKFAKLTGRGTP